MSYFHFLFFTFHIFTNFKTVTLPFSSLILQIYIPAGKSGTLMVTGTGISPVEKSIDLADQIDIHQRICIYPIVILHEVDQ